MGNISAVLELDQSIGCPKMQQILKSHAPEA